MKYQSQKSWLANDSIENIVDKEHMQQLYVEPWEINKRGQVDCKKKFNWVNNNKILPKLVRQVEYLFLRTHFDYFLQTCNIILYLILKMIENILIFLKILNFLKIGGKAGRGGGGAKRKIKFQTP